MIWDSVRVIFALASATNCCARSRPFRVCIERAYEERGELLTPANTHPCHIPRRIFAVLLFMYELVRVLVRCESAHQLMLKNFGFFFGAKGRGLYLIL